MVHGVHLSGPPAFFLAEGSTPSRLLPEDAQHCTRVLRLGVGDVLLGLDGRGRRQRLRIRAVGKLGPELEPSGPVEVVPEPGAEGAALPWFELAVSWPRRARVEDMIGRLVQLGAAAVRPLIASQRGPQEAPEGASERLLRLAREACKQSGRAWVPSFEPALDVAELLRVPEVGARAFLDPRAGLPFDTWLRSLRPSPGGSGVRAHPFVVAIGPEGGWSRDEERAFLEAGVSPAWLGPHVLRVETAAEAAMAVAAAVHGRSPASSRGDEALDSGPSL